MQNFGNSERHDDGYDDQAAAGVFPFMHLPYLAQLEIIQNLDLDSYTKFRRTCSQLNHTLLNSDISFTRKVQRIYVTKNSTTFSYITKEGEYKEYPWQILKTFPGRRKLRLEAKALCIDCNLDQTIVKRIIGLLSQIETKAESIEFVHRVLCSPNDLIVIFQKCQANALQFCSRIQFNPFQIPELQSIRHLQFSQSAPSDEEFLNLRLDGLKVRGDSLSNAAIRTYLRELAEGYRSTQSTCLIEYDEMFDFTEHDMNEITENLACILWTPQWHSYSIISSMKLDYPQSEYYIYIVFSQLYSNIQWKVIFHHGHLTIQPVTDIRYALPLTYTQFRIIFNECSECNIKQNCYHHIPKICQTVSVKADVKLVNTSYNITYSSTVMNFVKHILSYLLPIKSIITKVGNSLEKLHLI